MELAPIGYRRAIPKDQIKYLKMRMITEEPMLRLEMK